MRRSPYRRRGSWCVRLLWRLLARFTAVEQHRYISLGCFHAFADLDEDTLIELQLVAVLDVLAFPPMMVAYEIARVVVHHCPLVEGMEFEVSILPAFGLAPDIVGVQTSKLDDGRGVLGSRDTSRSCASKRRGRYRHVNPVRARATWSELDYGGC